MTDKEVYLSNKCPKCDTVLMTPEQVTDLAETYIKTKSLSGTPLRSHYFPFGFQRCSQCGELYGWFLFISLPIDKPFMIWISGMKESISLQQLIKEMFAKGLHPKAIHLAMIKVAQKQT